MTFTDNPQTYAEALGNLADENWHKERALIEAEVERVRVQTNLIPVEMTPAEVAAVLRDMAERVERGDSYEGNIMYALPDVPEWAQKGEPQPEGWVDRDYRLVRGVYRIGNLEGSGGSRMIGRVPGAELGDAVTEADT